MDTSDKSAASRSQWYGEQAQWYPETTATDPVGLGPAQASAQGPGSGTEPEPKPAPGPATNGPVAPEPVAPGPVAPGPVTVPEPASARVPEPGLVPEPEPERPVGGEPEPPGYAQHGPPPPFETTAADRPETPRPVPTPHPMPPAPQQQPRQGPPPPVFTPAEPAGPRPAPPAAGGQHPGIWHRLHLPIGVFLLAFGVTSTAGALISWAGHRQAISALLNKTIGSGASQAGPLLIGLHAVESLLLLVALAGLVRRRYVWYLPALVGWMAGFGAFAILDAWAGDLTAFAEHAAYFGGFTVLLLLSYALGLKARVNRRDPGQRSLTRTQEMALGAISHWQRRPPQM